MRVPGTLEFSHRGQGTVELKPRQTIVAPFRLAASQVGLFLLVLLFVVCGACRRSADVYKEQAQHILMPVTVRNAIVALTKAHEEDPYDGAVLANRGNAKLALGDIAGAYLDYLAASRIDPKYLIAIRNIAVYHYNKGLSLMEENKCDRAIEEFSAALDIDKNLCRASSNRGSCFSRVGQHDKAIGDFTSAIGKKPSEAIPYYNLGSELIVLNREAEATKALLRYQELTGKASPTIDEIIENFRSQQAAKSFPVKVVGLPLDFDEIIESLCARQAAEAPSVNSADTPPIGPADITKMGLLVESGNCVLALQKLLPLAQEGNAEAIALIAVMYTIGCGVPRDSTRAFVLHHRAAEKGFADSQALIGNAYFNGTIVDRDFAEALKWYRLAADQGNPEGRNGLGMMYYNGLGGLPQDRARAKDLWTKAAQSGNSAARNNLSSSQF